MWLDGLSHERKDWIISFVLEEVRRLNDELDALKQEVKVNNINKKAIVRTLKPVK